MIIMKYVQNGDKQPNLTFTFHICNIQCKYHCCMCVGDLSVYIVLA